MVDEARQAAETPDEVFEVLHKEYGFTVDVAASEVNHKLPAFMSKEENALACSWAGERVWCNPPYVDIDPWLEHALEPEFAAFLLPVRSFNVWWAKWKKFAECHWFIGRMNFKPPAGVKYSTTPFPVCLLLFGKGITPGAEAFRDAQTGERILDHVGLEQARSKKRKPVGQA